jgi:hypothetical protein
LNRRHKKIIGIKFPQKINIKNNSSKRAFFVKIGYEYNSVSKEKAYGISLFKKNGNSLIELSNNKKKEITAFSNKEFIFYTRHFVDSVLSIQEEFKPYIERMLAENKDTLHIGTVSDFKKKHKKLFEKLTKNDSIYIRFLEKKKLGKRITVPVNW